MTMVEQQMVDVLDGSRTMVEQGGSEVIVDVLDRLHHLRTTLRQCHQQVERVDFHVHALHTHQKDFSLLYTPRKPRDPGGTNIRGNHTHPGMFNFPEGVIQTSQDQEQAITKEEPEAVEEEQEDEKEKKMKYTKKDSMSEVREAEEHLLQTEWTEVVGELTESFELALEEVEEEEEEEEEGQRDTEDDASGARKRPPLRRQENLEVEDCHLNLSSNALNNLRLENNCDGDRVEEDKPFDSSHSPNLLAPEKQDINGIFPNVSKELCEDVTHSVAVGHDQSSASETDDHKSYPNHCNEDPVDRSFGPPVNVTYSLKVMQETLDLLRDHITLLHNTLSGSYKKPEHRRQVTSTIPSEVLTMFDFENPFGSEALHGDIKTVPDVEEPSTKLPDQDFKEPRPREGEEQIAQVIAEASLSTPESKNVTKVHQQHNNIFHKGRKQDLRDSLTTVLVMFLVMFALLFLACCLLLVVPVVTVSVRTTGGPPVF